MSGSGPGTTFLGLLSPTTLLNTLQAHPHHLVPLLASTVLTAGGIMTLTDPGSAIRAFGLPDYIANSHPGQVCFTVAGARVLAVSAAVFVFYSRAQFAEVDTLLGLLGLVGVVEGLVCFREGENGQAWAKWVVAAGLGVWGVAGFTEHGVF